MEQFYYYFTDKFNKSLKTARKKHPITEKDLMILTQSLGLTPVFGASIPKFNSLRKVRFNLERTNFGKSGGYRIIYSYVYIEEDLYLIFMEIYFKGDKEDLSHEEYQTLISKREEVIDNFDHHKEDFIKINIPDNHGFSSSVDN